jgi:ribonuclease P protein component
MEGKRSAARGAQAFPRRYRLGDNKNYRYVYRRGKSYPSRNLVLIYLKGKEQRFGFSVSSKVGNAVTRNRIRRFMREDVRKMRTTLKCGKYIFVARPALKKVPHAELTREMQSLLARAKLIKEDM